MHKPALLALADGNLFHGRSIGVDGETVGECVFNTAMSGYQEILSDPSYSRQLVTLTYPHIGNTGCNQDDMESDSVQAAGLIIRDLPRRGSNWRMQESLGEWLQRLGVVAIADIDTRRLTRILREQGAQGACIVAGDAPDATHALAQARAFAGLKGMDLAQHVSTQRAYTWSAGSLDLDHPDNTDTPPSRFHVVAYDFGVKHNILRMLVDRGCRVTVVPARTTAEEALAMQPDGIFLSNGPGDPEPCEYAIEAIRVFLQRGIPLFGICLGHQLLALALGARSLKMKFGHHGANHPVIDLATRRVMISSQNHGFAIDEDSLPEGVQATHRSLFDDSLQGIALSSAPAYGFQGHPEASPGPHDVAALFDPFIQAMAAAGPVN